MGSEASDVDQKIAQLTEKIKAIDEQKTILDAAQVEMPEIFWFEKILEKLKALNPESSGPLGF